ncbi:MAG: hypothetical protein ACU0CC_07520 [Sagittula sp.]|uniref:hypothetical protein n=1 Tax=unclassified Sagittula TaxID=2624628 RepID=UPI000C2D520C|nr:hypothetical protein [Sagittula sp. P11]AUC55581.1 hypothetical protein CDO87_21540 [Sagittula sp. P11]
MHKQISVLVLAGLVLSGCGGVRESRLNPFNWFGGSTSVRTEVRADDPAYNPLIPVREESVFRRKKDESYGGIAVDEVTGLFVERRPGGALVRATGVTRYQGAYDVKLVEVENETTDDTLVYALRAEQYVGPTGPVSARTVTAATWLTDNELALVRSIVVKARNNTRTTGR